MKNCVLILFIFLLPIDFARAGTDEKVFKGRIIVVQDDFIEVKNGPAEIKFFWCDTSEIFLKEKKLDRQTVEICQYVTVRFTVKNGRNELSRVEIFKESDCKR